MRETVNQDRNIFNGERLDSISPLSRNNLIEHLAKYNLVEGENKKVLDVGCGTGYGCNYLAQKHRLVCGIDVSLDAIKYAKKHWAAKNVDFSVGSGTQIPFDDNIFDITVLYEVFEHVSDWPKLLDEVKRVTKPNGKVYISTPNKDVYYPGLPPNPFHCFEMRADEFKEAINTFFLIDKFMGMRTPIYNDHWIWDVINPVLNEIKVSHKTRNTMNLKIINCIKPELSFSDIVFSAQEEDILKSRFIVAIATNKKEA